LYSAGVSTCSVYACVCLKWRMTKGARGFWWNQHPKRKSEELLLLASYGGTWSRNICTQFSPLHCTEWCDCFFSGVVFWYWPCRSHLYRNLLKNTDAWVLHLEIMAKQVWDGAPLNAVTKSWFCRP
jgi:hypothetical protein